MHLPEIEERLARLLRSAHGWLPSEQLAEMEALTRAGEPGVALENFCTQLEEYDIAVPDDVRRELTELASVMGIRVPRCVERSGRA